MLLLTLTSASSVPAAKRCFDGEPNADGGRVGWEPGETDIGRSTNSRLVASSKSMALAPHIPLLLEGPADDCSDLRGARDFAGTAAIVTHASSNTRAVPLTGAGFQTSDLTYTALPGIQMSERAGDGVDSAASIDAAPKLCGGTIEETDAELSPSVSRNSSTAGVPDCSRMADEESTTQILMDTSGDIALCCAFASSARRFSSLVERHAALPPLVPAVVLTLPSIATLTPTDELSDTPIL